MTTEEWIGVYGAALATVLAVKELIFPAVRWWRHRPRFRVDVGLGTMRQWGGPVSKGALDVRVINKSLTTFPSFRATLEIRHRSGLVQFPLNPMSADSDSRPDHANLYSLRGWELKMLPRDDPSLQATIVLYSAERRLAGKRPKRLLVSVLYLVDTHRALLPGGSTALESPPADHTA
jgi:hypothetical protein